MNFLGHAYLSFNDPNLLVGNMIGDYIKGHEALEKLPPAIQKGIHLHRFIDEYTDHHPASLRAKNYFRESYRLYAGAFVDCMYDHFLANDPKCFTSDAQLKSFTEEVYSILEANKAVLPEKFVEMLPYMKAENWLYDNRTIRGVSKSFERMARRAQYIDDTTAAYQAFVGNFYILNQCFLEFIEDAEVAVQAEIERIKNS